MPKIHLRVGDFTLDVEGEEEFVRAVYGDFKEAMSLRTLPRLDQKEIETNPSISEPSANRVEEPKLAKKSSRRSAKRPTNKLDSTNHKGQTFPSPMVVPNLDTHGIKDFFSLYNCKNNSDRLLVVAQSLCSKKGKTLVSSNEIYTAFLALKLKVPRAWAQAFYDARHPSCGFIKFEEATEIEVTHMGMNRLNEIEAQ